MDTINIIILFSLIISIALGYVLKANIGVFAILSAFIGAYLYGITPEKVINLWNGSLSLFFILLSITYFYGFAIANGTLNNLALKAVYSVRKTLEYSYCTLYYSYGICRNWTRTLCRLCFYESFGSLYC